LLKRFRGRFIRIIDHCTTSGNHDERKSAKTPQENEIVPVPAVERCAKRTGTQRQKAVIHKVREFAFKIWSEVENPGQDITAFFPLVVGRRKNATGFLKRFD
jgi:hypothetical protein